MMNKVWLVIGGARSGKSRFAENLVRDAAEPIRIYTAFAGDAEMQARIERHKADRVRNGVEIEEQTEIADIIRRHDRPGAVILTDCLTLWLSNLMFHEKNITAYKENLLNVLQKSQARIILISNETGCGIVPENALARRFRDEQGLLNQEIGALADRVSLISAGFEVKLKEISAF